MKCMLCALISLIEAIVMRTLNVPKLYLFAFWPGVMINPQWLELSMSRTNLNGKTG